MAIADLADVPEVALDRRDGPRRGAAHGLGDEGDHRLWAELGDLGFQLVGKPFTVLSGCLIGLPTAILEARRDMMGLDQERGELCTAPCVAADRQRS